MKPEKKTPQKAADNNFVEIDDATAAFLEERARLWQEGKLEGRTVTAEEFRAEMEALMAPGNVLVDAYKKAMKDNNGDPNNDADVGKAHAEAVKAYDAFMAKQGKGPRQK